MSTEEKLQAMESIWEDLCKSANDVSSPTWHKTLLDERDKAIERGEDEFSDWEKAKRDIKNRIS
jgi:hypothetical protein